MIETVVGNVLTDLCVRKHYDDPHAHRRNDRHFIVHGCNSKGVMASGIAKDIRAMFPIAYNVYRTEHSRNGLKMGSFTEFHAYRNGHDPENPKLIKHNAALRDLHIINAITQENYGRDPNVVYVSYEAILSAFTSLNTLIAERHAEELDRVTVHFPLIGCGLANGDWDVVSEIIDTSLTVCKKVLWVLP